MPITLTLALRLATLVLVGPSVLVAQEAPGTVPHVRGADALSGEVLEAATRISPTVARLVAELQSSDLIVTVSTGVARGNVNGLARVMGAAGGFRHVRVVLRIPNSRPALMEVLGHELQHCVEIARMPDVRDEATLAAAYRRVGVAMARGGFFETEAAVRTGTLVAREVAAAGIR